MRDIHKGVILLFLAVLASIVSLSVDDRHWEMPFMTFDSDPHSDVADLQAQLLAGLDPTENAAPTAAGVTAKAVNTPCFAGKIARDNSTDEFHNALYLAIKQSNDTYIEVIQSQTYLIKGAFETQSASIIESFPSAVEQKIGQISNITSCKQLDVYLSKINNG
ncbi:MAG: hypothetical protein HRU06_11065 [Oceanospirillaceae bacterium]|nr:hypothetical protein [Oceanospirillaceae bacterium]